MKFGVKALFTFGILGLAMPIFAMLPESVERACFSMQLEDVVHQTRWEVSSWDTWRGAAGLSLQMDKDGGYSASLPGAMDKNEIFLTELTLSSPAITSYQQQPLQTLTLTVTAKGFVEKTTVLVDLMKDVELPPFTIQVVHGRMVMVANDKQWYIVIDDPKARVHQAKDNSYRVTVSVAAMEFDGKVRQQTAKLYIGEGEMQPAMIAPIATTSTK